MFVTSRQSSEGRGGEEKLALKGGAAAVLLWRRRIFLTWFRAPQTCCLRSPSCLQSCWFGVFGFRICGFCLAS